MRNVTIKDLKPLPTKTFVKSDGTVVTVVTEDYSLKNVFKRALEAIDESSD